MDRRLELEELLEPINAGENELKNFLRAQPRIERVQDVSNNPKYWHKDIDLIIYPNGAAQYTAEVKWDNRISTTENLYIETYNPRSKDSKGWFYFCEADYLFYGDSINQIFYIFNTKELFTYIKENNFPIKSTLDGSSGFIVPLTEVAHLYRKIYIS